MVEAIERIESYISGYDQSTFMSDEKTIDAVVRQLEILGEAASQVPSDLVKDSPIPWKAIVGLRNKLIHEYFGVDYEIVWDTVTNKLKGLKEYLKNKSF